MLEIFFFNDTATTEIYTLSLHDALPISLLPCSSCNFKCSPCNVPHPDMSPSCSCSPLPLPSLNESLGYRKDRKSTRLNSSHANISYAVFCLKKNKHTALSSSSPTLHHRP